jgi:hypothetical protein
MTDDLGEAINNAVRRGWLSEGANGTHTVTRAGCRRAWLLFGISPPPRARKGKENLNRRQVNINSTVRIEAPWD